VSRIVKLVVESRRRKASIEKLVDRFARFYVPVIICLSAFTAIFVPVMVGGSFNVWLYKSLILLVISCPSAFVISVPATIFTAVTLAARKGVIIKGGVYVKRLRGQGIIFDKTGTLTLGMPDVHDIQSMRNLTRSILNMPLPRTVFQSSNCQSDSQKSVRTGLPSAELEVKDVEEVLRDRHCGFCEWRKGVVGNMEMMQNTDAMR